MSLLYTLAITNPGAHKLARPPLHARLAASLARLRALMVRHQRPAVSPAPATPPAGAGLTIPVKATPDAPPWAAGRLAPDTTGPISAARLWPAWDDGRWQWQSSRRRPAHAAAPTVAMPALAEAGQ